MVKHSTGRDEVEKKHNENFGSFACHSEEAAAAAAKSLQSCPTLRDPMDCSPPGSSTHGIFQARVLEWLAIAFSNKAFCTFFFGIYVMIKKKRN